MASTSWTRPVCQAEPSIRFCAGSIAKGCSPRLGKAGRRPTRATPASTLLRDHRRRRSDARGRGRALPRLDQAVAGGPDPRRSDLRAHDTHRHFGSGCCFACRCSLVRLSPTVVPSGSRRDWRAEWEAEVRHYWDCSIAAIVSTGGPVWICFRRALGALPDAAWLRRQFTADADLVHDVRHGMRMLGKSPSFALAAVFILALGIGGTVSIVALLDTLLFKPLPYQDADRTSSRSGSGTPRGRGARRRRAGQLSGLARSIAIVSAIAGIIPYSSDFTGGTEPEVLFGAQVTEGFFDAIGMPPVIGRGFLPEEHTAGGRRVVVITHGFWQSRFGR